MKKGSIFKDVAILSGSLIITDLIGALGNLTFLPWYRPLPSLITVLAIIFISVTYARSNVNQLKFSMVLGHAMKAALLSSIFIVLYTGIALGFLFPHLKELVIDQTRVELINNPDLSAGTLDTALAITRRFFLPLAMIAAFFSILIVGLIGGMLSFFFCRPYLRED